MIDLHCHILPGVDDGAATEDESCMMARLAVDSGVTALAATPHCGVPGQFDNFVDEHFLARFGALKAMLEREHIPLRLYTGMEVFVTEETPRLLRQGRLLTLGGSRYLLVEFGFHALYVPAAFDRFIYLSLLTDDPARTIRYLLGEDL